MAQTPKIYNCVCEKEISFKLEIPQLVYNKLMCCFENLPYQSITKLNYSKPEGFRVIFGHDYTIKQIKTEQEYKEDYLYYKNNFIFKTLIKKSVEKTVPGFNNYEDDKNLESSIQRHFIYNNPNKKLRIGLEKKFASSYCDNNKNNNNNLFTMQCLKNNNQSSTPMQLPPSSSVSYNSKITKSNVLALDKWVRLASQTFIHVEFEYTGDTNAAIVELQQELESSKLFEEIMTHVTDVCNNVSLTLLIENKLYSSGRDFATILTEKPLYVAWKLDGIRKTCIIHQNTLIVDGVKTIALSKKIAQPIKCHIEIIDDIYYIIDILEIWGPKFIYIKPNHLESIKIIQSDFIQQITTPNLLTNKYFVPGSKLPLTTIQNDGLLMYTKKQIIKNKEHTIDLVLIKPNKRNEKKIKKCKYGFYSKNGTTIGKETHVVQHHCIEELLLFADKTSFSSVFPGWVVEVNNKNSNKINNEMSTTHFINYIFDENNTSKTNNLSITNFIILEFKLDYNNKKIIFLKKRTDKMQANTSQTMFKMFDY